MKFFNSNKIVHLYLALLMLYYGQGFLFGEGLLARLILVLFVGISFYYWMYAITKYKLPFPLKMLSILLVIWTLYGIPPILFGSKAAVSEGFETYHYLKTIYISMLPIYTFYVFSQKKILTDSILRGWFVAFIIVAIGNYYYGMQKALNLMVEKGVDASEATNNSGYFVATLLCLVPVFYNKKFLLYSVMGICLFFTISSFKRGAILSALLCCCIIVWYSLKSQKFEVRKKRKTFRIWVLLFVFIVVGCFFVANILATSDYFSYRLEQTLEGSSSGRDDIYSSFLNYFMSENSFKTFLFGNGAYGTLEIFGCFAHNDWLEIAIDNGLFLLVLYAVYWVSLLVTLSRGDKQSYYTTIFASFVIIYFLRSFLSMSYSDVTPYASCAIGFSLANYQEKKKLKHYDRRYCCR